MAKFLTYEDWLEIQNGLKEYMTFTRIGEKLERDRATITKELLCGAGHRLQCLSA